MTTATLDLLPAHRLGPLLTKQRNENGLNLEDLALQSGGQFDVDRLGEIERGQRSVDPEQMTQLSALYRVDCHTIVPQRAKLCLDLGAQSLRVGEEEVRLRRKNHKYVLDRYLGLVYLLRNIEPGTEIPMRADDLAILEASLNERAELLEEQLLAAMAANDQALVSLIVRLRSTLIIPAAGILVGAVTLGSLVLAAPSEADGNSSRTLGASEPSSLSIDSTSSRSVQPLTGASGTALNNTALNNTPTDGTVATIEAVLEPSSELAARGSVQPVIESLDAAADLQMANASREDQLGAQALDIIGVDLQQTLPGWTLSFEASNGAQRGVTYPHDKHIVVSIRSNDTATDVASILAHEMGHAFDVTHLEPSERDQWLEVREIGPQWWVDAYLSDFEAGQGDFAEAFATHLTGDSVHPHAAGQLDDAERAVLEELLAPNLHLRG